MTEMTASCLITVQPHIEVNRYPVLIDAIIDKLWPGNAGGVKFLFRSRLGEALAPLIAEVKTRGQACRFRIHRDGVSYRIEPA